jgi:hypothetical protein
MSKWIKKLTERYAEVNENQKMANAKALAKATASSEKGKKAVTLPKAPFEIPEDVPIPERDMFMAKAAAAHKAGKSHFTMPGGKKHPVTMQKDTAKAVNSEAVEPKKEMSSKEKMKKGLYNGSKDNEEIEMNPKKDKKASAADVGVMPEGREWTVYSRILENRAAHYKGAAPADPMDKGLAPNAKAMKKKMDDGKEINNFDELGHQDASKAGRTTKQAPARNGDRKEGDKNIIPSATPMKGQ